MMKFGLKDNEIKDIQKVFSQYPEVETVIIFGSRAKGNFKPASDIDIALKGADLNITVLNKISVALDDSSLPYIFDLVLFQQISNKELIEHIERVGEVFYEREGLSESFSEWNTYTLDDFAELRKEQIQPKGAEQIYIGLEHIEQQTLRLNSYGSSKDVISNKFKFYAGDILYGKLRPYFRKVYKPKFEGVCSTDIYVIKGKQNIDKSFLFYLIATEEFTQIANSGSTGTRMPRADWSQLKKSEWLIPNIDVQKAIGSFLYSLDDKIELNRQTNQTLEAIAQTLFKEMCVPVNNELAKGWKVGTMGEIFELQRGFDLPASTRTNGKYPVIAASGFNGFHNEYKNKAHGVTTGRSGVLGNVFYIQEPFWALNTSLFVKDFKIGHPIFTFFLLKTIDLKSYNGGSAVPTLNRNDVHKIEVVIPPISNINRFSAFAKDFFELIHSNEKEIQSLINIRDSLLPKLMKGEVKIK